MNEKNETRTMYPFESIKWLWTLYFDIVYPDIESEDQLDSLLEDLKPALDAWINKAGFLRGDVVALLYYPPGNLHRRTVCSHIVPIISNHHEYSFQEIVRQLSNPPNVTFDEADLSSLDELKRTDWTGCLAIMMIPGEVWKTLPTTNPALPLDDIHEYLHETIVQATAWLQVHPMPNGWRMDCIFGD